MDACLRTASTTPRTTESMLGSGPRSRKMPSRKELLAKSTEVERLSSSTATRSGKFLAPTATATAIAEQTSLLSRVPFVGKCLVEGSVVAFVVAILTVMACFPCRWRPAPSPDPSPGPSPGPFRDPIHDPWPYPNPSATQRVPRG